MFDTDRVLQELEVLVLVLVLVLVWVLACWQAQSETMAHLLAVAEPG